MQDPAEQSEGEGGGVLEALKSLDQGLSDVTEAASQDESVPDEAKAAFQSAREAFRAGLEIMAGGGQPQPADKGVVSPEQGASGAQPMSHGRPG